jgi:hypothetical protein
MTEQHPSESSVRRQRTGGKPRRQTAAQTRTARARSGRRVGPAVEPGPDPIPVQVRVGNRWIAGQALHSRTGASGRGELLVSHHGHLLWVDRHDVRLR